MDLWEYMMFDRPVSIKTWRMKEPPPTGRRRKEESEGWRKGSDGGDNRGELWNATASGHLLARHIPVGSQALNQLDPQNQQKSKVRQALTFPEKIPCPSPLLHSFASSWFTFKSIKIYFNSRACFPWCSLFFPTSIRIPQTPNCYFPLD